MTCGVRFCGGCNPRYDRGLALEEIKDYFLGKIEFQSAEEGVEYDLILVIGGCGSCCASYDQFTTREGVVKMWEQSHIENIKKIIADFNY